MVNIADQSEDTDSTREVKRSNLDNYKYTNGPSCSINVSRKQGLSSEYSSSGCNCTALRDDVQDIKNRLYKLESSMKEDMKLVLVLLRSRQKSSIGDRTKDDFDLSGSSASISCTNIFYDAGLATSSKV